MSKVAIAAHTFYLVAWSDEIYAIFLVMMEDVTFFPCDIAGA